MKQGNQEKVKVAEKGGTIVIAQNFSKCKRCVLSN
jgi:hypothetical protein